MTEGPVLTTTQRWVLVAMVLLAAIGVWLVLRQMGLPASFSATAMAHWLTGSGPWGPVLLCLLMVLAIVIGPIPTLPISAAAGLAYGLWAGTLLAAIGATLGALIAFLLTRLLGREAVRRRLPDNPFFAANARQNLLFWSILLTRLLPLFSFALISYAAGLTAITLGRFLLATFIGMLPMTLVFAGLGQGLEINPVLSVTAAGLVLLVMVLAPYWLQRHPRLRRWVQAQAVLEARNEERNEQRNKD